MALIVLILLMALIRIMLRITDRGSLERAILSRRRFADPIVTSYETMAGQIHEDEMPFEFDAVAERLDPGARGRISRAYGARVVILAALCQGAAVVGLAPTWVLAVIPAASTFVLPALDAELLARQGRTAPPAKTPAQKSVELVANLMCGALAWPAFYLCFERGDNPVPVALAATRSCLQHTWHADSVCASRSALPLRSSRRAQLETQSSICDPSRMIVNRCIAQ